MFGEWRRVGGNFISGIVCPENGTGFPPAHLLFEENLRIPHTILCENQMQEPEVSQNLVDYALDLNERLKDAKIQQWNMCRNVNLNKSCGMTGMPYCRSLSWGTWWLVLAVAKPHKTAVQWRGPGIVTSVISNTNFLNTYDKI